MGPLFSSSFLNVCLLTKAFQLCKKTEFQQEHMSPCKHCRQTKLLNLIQILQLLKVRMAASRLLSPRIKSLVCMVQVHRVV